MLGALEDDDDSSKHNTTHNGMTPHSTLGRNGVTTYHDVPVPGRSLTLSQLGDNNVLNGVDSSQFTSVKNEANSDSKHSLKPKKLPDGDYMESQKINTQIGHLHPQRQCRPSEPSPESDQLYEIDLELPGQRPQLLHIPSQPATQQIHLPNISQQAWPEKHSTWSPDDDRLQDIPERDTSPGIQMLGGQRSILNSMPFPLLSLSQPDTGSSYFAGGQPRIPHLIPPEEIISYEERKYKTSVTKARQVFQFVNEQMASQMAAQKQPEPLGKHLLKPDVFEPFGPLDERDKKQRSVS